LTTHAIQSSTPAWNVRAALIFLSSSHLSVLSWIVNVWQFARGTRASYDQTEPMHSANYVYTKRGKASTASQIFIQPQVTTQLLSNAVRSPGLPLWNYLWEICKKSWIELLRGSHAQQPLSRMRSGTVNRTSFFSFCPIAVCFFRFILPSHPYIRSSVKHPVQS
jgi:hypothetical protein